MSFSKDFRRKISLAVPPMSRKGLYTITFYTGGVDLADWQTLTFEQKEIALSKPWKIRWWYRNPETRKLERQNDIKGQVNRYKTMTERLQCMRDYKKAMTELLSDGYNPYTFTPKEADTPSMNAEKAILYALEIKKQTVSPQTYADYNMHAQGLIKYLRKQGRIHHDIKFISRRVVSDYLDTVLKKTSAKSRNNARGNLSAIFAVLSEKYLVPSNFIKNDIPKLRTRSKTDRRFSKAQMKKIADYLREHDPYMLLFIKIVAYNFLRPIEVVRLTVGNIDLEAREMYFDQKTKVGKTKYIPEIYFNEIADLVRGLPGEYHLFTPEGKPGIWTAADRDKRNYWSKKFKKVKNEVGIGEGFGMYSFRHSLISGTYAVLREKMGRIEALEYLMKITGHESKEGIQKYIHINDADRPEDWSDVIGFKL